MACFVSTLAGPMLQGIFAKENLCSFDSRESASPGGCGQNTVATVREVERLPQRSVVHVEVKKRGTYAGAIMFQACSFAKIAKSRGYRYFVTLKENELKTCGDCEWSTEYVLGFLHSPQDSIQGAFPEQYQENKKYEITDINPSGMICGYLPIPDSNFLRAVYFGKLDKVKQMVEKNRGLLDEKDPQGFSALHLAAVEGHLGLIEYLAKSGARVNQRGMYGWTPLHLAARSTCIAPVKMLLSLDADPGLKSRVGNTPLHTAAYRGHVDLADLFLQQGVFVDETDFEGNTPLHGAAARGQLEMVRFLLSKGADPSKKNTDNQTPLDFAQEQNYSEIIKVLGDSGH